MSKTSNELSTLLIFCGVCILEGVSVGKTVCISRRARPMKRGEKWRLVVFFLFGWLRKTVLCQYYLALLEIFLKLRVSDKKIKQIVRMVHRYMVHHFIQILLIINAF